MGFQSAVNGAIGAIAQMTSIRKFLANQDKTVEQVSTLSQDGKEIDLSEKSMAEQVKRNSAKEFAKPDETINTSVDSPDGRSFNISGTSMAGSLKRNINVGTFMTPEQKAALALEQAKEEKRVALSLKHKNRNKRL